MFPLRVAPWSALNGTAAYLKRTLHFDSMMRPVCCRERGIYELFAKLRATVEACRNAQFLQQSREHPLRVVS